MPPNFNHQLILYLLISNSFVLTLQNVKFKQTEYGYHRKAPKNVFTSKPPIFPPLTDLQGGAGAIFLNHNYHYQNYNNLNFNTNWSLEAYQIFQQEWNDRTRISCEEWQSDLELSFDLMRESLCSFNQRNHQIVQEGEVLYDGGIRYTCDKIGKNRIFRPFMFGFVPDVKGYINDKSFKDMNIHHSNTILEDPHNLEKANLIFQQPKILPFKVLEYIVDYFQQCPESPSYTLISDATLDEIFRLSKAHNYEFPDHVLNFNYNRLPCCRIDRGYNIRTTPIDEKIYQFIKQKFPFNYEKFFTVSSMSPDQLMTIFREMENETGENSDSMLAELSKVIAMGLAKSPQDLYKRPEFQKFMKNTQIARNIMEKKNTTDKIPNPYFYQIKTHNRDVGSQAIGCGFHVT